ncbi:MAG: response regulator transcription factor [Rhizobiales bacterium]|nr:response regulator transcription factor [Hyphomicrobiales bacterium]
MAVPSFLIVDDHPLFLEALQSAIEAGFPGARVDVTETIQGACKVLAGKKFNLVLLDLKVPDANGYDGLQQVRATAKKTPLAVISAMTGPEIVNKVKALGADGFITKSQPRKDILASVATILNGGNSFPSGTGDGGVSGEVQELIEKLRQLTPQQLKVLTRVCEAKLNKQIAYELGITETTIKAHITLIFKKLGMHSRTQAVLTMQRMKSELADTEFGGLFAAEG